MLSRVALLGQAPSSSSDPGWPLSGRTGRRIAALAGLGYPGEYEIAFRRFNLLDRYPGRCGAKGDRFPLLEARKRVVELAPELMDSVVVALGRNVLRVFGLHDLSWFEAGAVSVAGAQVLAKVLVHAFPHPSGVNLWFNDSENRERFGRELRGLINDNRPRAPVESVLD